MPTPSPDSIESLVAVLVSIRRRASVRRVDVSPPVCNANADWPEHSVGEVAKRYK